MDNQNLDGLQISSNPSSIYPSPATGPLAEHHEPPTQNPLPYQAPATTNYNIWSLAIFILLILTFFSPLGSILFLPLVLVGLVSAVNHVRKPKGTSTQAAPLTPGMIIFRVLIGVCMVIGIGILCIMGFLFIIFSSGGGRMGS